MADAGINTEQKGLLCPTCRVDLIMSERQGIEIDYCPKCRGVWLDRGELDKIIEKSIGDQRPSAPFVPQPASDSYVSNEQYRGGHGSKHGRAGRRESFLGRLFD